MSKIGQNDIPMWDNPKAWTYLLHAFRILNNEDHLPNGGGDIENVANNSIIYINSFVRPRSSAKVTACDFQRILREYLFTSRRANIVISNTEMDKECQTNLPCSQSDTTLCIPLLSPNLEISTIPKQLSVSSTTTTTTTKSKSTKSKINNGRRGGYNTTFKHPTYPFWFQ